MTTLLVHPATGPLRGIVPGPPDALAAVAAAVLGALAQGTTCLAGRGLPALPVLQALGALGVVAEQSEGGVRIEGRGLHGLRPPDRAVPGGADPLSLAALAAVLAGQRFASTLTGDEASFRAYLGPVAAVLRGRGARIEGELVAERVGELHPPLDIEPSCLLGPAGPVLSEASYELGAGEWLARTAALVSGLYADGPTEVAEPVVACDVVERTLAAMGVPVETAGPVIRFDPARWSGELGALDGPLPADPGTSAYLLAAAALVEGSVIGVPAVAASPSRTGAWTVLAHAGMPLHTVPRPSRLEHPTADVTAGHAPLRPLQASGEVALRAETGLPLFAVLAARARGESELCHVPPPPRASRPPDTARLLAAFGVEHHHTAEGLRVRGVTGPFSPCRFDAQGDGHLAMAGALLALAASGPCEIAGAEGIVGVMPRFVGCLRALGAVVVVQES